MLLLLTSRDPDLLPVKVGANVKERDGYIEMIFYRCSQCTFNTWEGRSIPGLESFYTYP